MTDGTHTATHTYAADGSFTFNLTGFNDGAITSSMVITDAAGNTKTITGATPRWTPRRTAAPAACADGGRPADEQRREDGGRLYRRRAGCRRQCVGDGDRRCAQATHAYAADGSFAFDLTGLQRRRGTSSMVITDAAGNTKNVSRRLATLDTTADGASGGGG